MTSEMTTFRKKVVRDWTSKDVKDWIQSMATEFPLDEVEFDDFTGGDLVLMSCEDLDAHMRPSNRNLSQHLHSRLQQRLKMESKPKKASVSIPRFLKNLLNDPKYCPSIIKWEKMSENMFRLVKPDEVAKLWGIKRNKAMSFEKFSRAIRYHYNKGRLIQVPSVRLIYQFGPETTVPLSTLETTHDSAGPDQGTYKRSDSPTSRILRNAPFQHCYHRLLNNK